MSTDAGVEATETMSQSDIDISIQTGAWKDRQQAPPAPHVGESQAAADECAAGRRGEANGYADRGATLANVQQAEAAYRSDPMQPGVTAAYLAALETARNVAQSAYRQAIVGAGEAAKKAVALAGPNPVAREQAKAKAMTENARWLGETEAAAEAASLAYDRGAVDVARTCKLAEVRINYARERIAERERAGADILQKANPFSAPAKIKITMSEFDSITDPAMKERAAREAIIVDDPPVKFTRQDAANVLRSRGSTRRLLTMAEFNALPPDQQGEAARSAILFDE